MAARVVSGVRDYVNHLRFQRNAWLYLASAIIVGTSLGAFSLLFNFYALSLGYNEALLGNLVTVSSLTALLVALPMGYLSDLIGRKASLVKDGFHVVEIKFNGRIEGLGLGHSSSGGKPGGLAMDGDFGTIHIQPDISPIQPIALNDFPDAAVALEPFRRGAFGCANPDQFNFVVWGK